jgi:hypothetical protein
LIVRNDAVCVEAIGERRNTTSYHVGQPYWKRRADPRTWFSALDGQYLLQESVLLWEPGQGLGDPVTGRVGDKELNVHNTPLKAAIVPNAICMLAEDSQFIRYSIRYTTTPVTETYSQIGIVQRASRT